MKIFDNICPQKQVANKYDPFYSGDKEERIVQCKALDYLIEKGIRSPRNAWGATYMVGVSLKSGESFDSAFEQYKLLYDAHLSHIEHEAPFPQGPESAALAEANSSYRLLDDFVSNSDSRKALVSDFINILQSTEDARKAREDFLIKHPKKCIVKKKNFIQKILPKVKNCVVTTGKFTAGAISGMLMDAFIIPAGVAYYGAKKTGADIKNLIKDKNYQLWSTCLKDFAMTTLGTMASCLMGPGFGALSGILDADEDGLCFAVQNRINDFKFCEELVEDVVNNKESHILW